jgi:hypothetical protein
MSAFCELIVALEIPRLRDEPLHEGSFESASWRREFKSQQSSEEGSLIVKLLVCG